MTKELTLISVLMSVYNESEEWLRQSIESILTQTYRDFEFIIVNDNPTSVIHKNILSEYKKKDSRVVIITNTINIGLTRSLNVGLAQVKGKYIARMDADDISYPERLATQVQFMDKNPTCVASGTWMNIFSDTKKMILIEFPCSDEDIKYQLLLDNCIPHPSAMIRTECIVNNSIFYDENLRFSQDYGLWCTLSQFGTLANLNLPLLKYRISEQQISSGKRILQNDCTTLIRNNYYELFLKNLGFTRDSRKTVSNIKQLLIDTNHKNMLLWSHYQNSGVLGRYINPLINLDILSLKEHYIKSLKKESKLFIFKLKKLGVK